MTLDQSHYREVAQWEIFMEQELGFGLDLVTFEAVFFMGKIFFSQQAHAPPTAEGRWRRQRA